jgi:hypothetical protein
MEPRLAALLKTCPRETHERLTTATQHIVRVCATPVPTTDTLALAMDAKRDLVECVGDVKVPSLAPCAVAFAKARDALLSAAAAEVRVLRARLQTRVAQVAAARIGQRRL